MTPIADEDPARDAWLREALRHAPDAGAAPPPAVTKAILRQAHAAAATARTAPLRGVTQAFGAMWDWLARPPVAAGFASLMLATLVGMMWWGRPMDEALPRAPAVATPPAAATPDVREHTAAPAEVPAATAAADATAGIGPAVQTQRPKVAPRAKLATPSAAVPRTASAAALAVPLPEPTGETAAVADAAPPAADAVRPVPPVQAATASAPAFAAAEAQEATPQPESARAETAPRTATAATPMAGAAVQQRAQGRASTSNLQQQFAPPSPEWSKQARPLAGLRDALAAQPQRWTWQRGAGREEPMNAAVQRWLAGLDAATAPRWRAAAPRQRSDISAPALGEMSEIRLLRDGRLHTTLRIGATSARIEAADAASPGLEVELPEASAAALRAQLEQAAP